MCTVYSMHHATFELWLWIIVWFFTSNFPNLKFVSKPWPIYWTPSRRFELFHCIGAIVWFGVNHLQHFPLPSRTWPESSKTVPPARPSSQAGKHVPFVPCTDVFVPVQFPVVLCVPSIRRENIFGPDEIKEYYSGLFVDQRSSNRKRRLFVGADCDTHLQQQR